LKTIEHIYKDNIVRESIHMKKINLGLLGFGTVGTGVVKILKENGNLIASRLGAELNLKYIADIDLKTNRGLKINKKLLVTDAQKVIDDPEVDIVIEMIGGKKAAKDLILKAIHNGKHVVTANKALIAEQGQELFDAATKKGVDLAFEASVGGCMPIVKTIRESLVGNHIQSMTGILNGTCNYILSKITDDGSTFKDALAEAQANGFAEADPTLDVQGVDAAHKLAILSTLAYGLKIDFSKIFIEGITHITPLDIGFAREFGYRIKLLAISKDAGDAVELRVHPTMIPDDTLLSNVNGSLNAVTISSDKAGDMLLYGHGAGMMPTASAVVSDIVDISRNLLSGAKRRIPLLSFQKDAIRKIPILPVDKIQTNYYFRFSALDRPGVLSKISGVLGKHGISLKSVHQKGRRERSVPIVMLTHLARESDVKKAMTKINKLDVIKGKPTVIRIEGESGADS
jgi:homoserine dehydrogenase